MPHRDDLAAAHARIAALERELAAATKESRAPLRCARCGGTFEPGDLDRSSGQLTCRNCRRTLDAGRPPPRRRDAPDGIEVKDSPPQLRIEWKWQLSPLELGIVSAAIFGILVLLTLTLIAADGDTGRALMPSIVLGLFGLVLVGWVIRQLANRTVILVSDCVLHIETRPLAMRPVQLLARKEIDQLFCAIGHSKHATWYELWAQLKSGRRQRLLSPLPDATRAFFMEREIERRFDMADRPVEGEVPRRDG